MPYADRTIVHDVGSQAYVSTLLKIFAVPTPPGFR